MSELKRLFGSVPFLSPLLRWGWDILTISRFKREHHAHIRRLEQENIALVRRCDELSRRCDELAGRLEHTEAQIRPTIETEVASQLHYQSLALQQQVDQLGFDARIFSAGPA